MKIGIIGAAQGLWRMARDGGLDPLVRPTSPAEAALLAAAQVATAADDTAFLEALEHPRLHVLDLAPGAGVDAVIDAAYVTMEPGDVVIDASGGYWGDTLRRWRRMRHRSLFYIDLAILHAQPPLLLVGGEERGLQHALPALNKLGRTIVAGEPGTAHYALSIRDALMTTLAHAASEARQLLEAFPGELDAPAVMAQLAPERTSGPRAGWLLDDALHLEAAVPLMAHAVMLEMAHHLDEQLDRHVLPRLGPFTTREHLE